jgi:chromosome segregation ATPase
MCEKLTVFFYPKNQKRRSITMTKPKTLDQLRAEKERAETQLAQEKHKLERLENRKKYLEKGERTKRTHRLCNLGGTIESLAPEVKDLTRTEMTELMEHIFSLSEVQRAVRHQPSKQRKGVESRWHYFI